MKNFVKNNLLLVSIVIPCRNEEKSIGECLDSIIGNSYPKDKLEILVVDGMSEDGTKEIVKRYSEKHSLIRLLDNPKKIVPTAMNIGIKESKGIVIMRMDAHTEYPKDYISKIIYWLDKSGVDNVGGILITRPGSNTLIAETVALSLSSPFGVGNAMFRIGLKEPGYVDTVPFGAYRKEVFSKIGLFDEELVRNQDDEFNYRLIKSGGKILLVPEIVSYYYARDSLLKLWRMYFQYGYWKIRVIQKHKLPASWRHIVPATFVLSIVGSGVLTLLSDLGIYFLGTVVSLYLSTSLLFSAKISVREGGRYLPILPIVFATLHFSYGFGFLKGIWDFVVLRKHKRKRVEDQKLTR